MREHLNGRTVIPVQEWQEERNNLFSKNNSLIADYRKLKTDIQSIESIRKYAEKVQSEDLIPQKKKSKER
jgi:hypothetical protein